MRKTLLALTAIWAAMSATAQSPALINSGLVLQQGSKLHDEGKFKDAINLYKTIPRNDTNYLRALYELAMTHERDSSFAEGLDAIRSAEELGTDEMESKFLLMKASLLDGAGQPQRAIGIYDSVLRKYPHSDEAMLNRAITLMRMEQYPEAAQQLRTLLVHNPFFASAHMKMANCAIKEGRIVPAMMALFTYLVVNPEGRHSNSAIKLLSEIANNSGDVQEIVQNRKKDEDVFNREERVLFSKMAFDKDYKLLTDIDDKIIRQLQALVDILKYDESSDDFYMQFYVPFFRTLTEKKKFEPIVNHAFSGVQVEVIQKYMKRNTREVRTAITDVVNYFDGIRTSGELVASRRSANSIQNYISNNLLFGRGRANAKEDPIGYWEYFYNEGSLKAAGTFDDAGKKTGRWQYYYTNGVRRAVKYWNNDLESGTDSFFFSDGTLSTVSMYNDAGKLEGKKTLYYGNGNVKSVTTYKNDQEDGPYHSYFASGRPHSDVMMKADKQHGPFKRFYKSGAVDSEGNYENGELDGPYKSYYENGRLSFEGTYKAGKLEGVAKNYHNNGKLKEERTIVNGLVEGIDNEYDDAGTLRSATPYVKGKAQGIAHFYDYDGKESSTSVFEKGIMQEVRYLDKTGKEIAIFKRKGRSFKVTAYEADGTKNCDQEYNDKGERDGMLTLYYSNGKVHQTIPYKNGLVEGVVTSFYPDGSKEFEIEHHGGEKDGLDKSWFPNGKLQLAGYFKEGEEDGDWVTYNHKGNISSRYTYRDNDLTGFSESYLADGSLDNELIYENGWLRGINQYDSTGKRIFHTAVNRTSSRYTSIYPNGQKRYDGGYDHGDFNGKMTHYYFNGKVQSEKTYDRGLLEGAYTEYFFNGKVSVSGQYLHNMRTGVWKTYGEDGRLIEEENFLNDELNGKDIAFFSTGKPNMTCDFKNGEKHGLVQRFDPSGNLIMSLQYVEGELKGYSYLGKDGQMVPMIAMPGGSGRVVAYFANGTKSAEIDYLDSRIHGDFILYHQNGKVYWKSKENWGHTDGEAREYFPNGQVSSEFTYIQDNAEGAFKLYYDNGKVKEEGFRYGGVRHGWTTYYDVTGKRTAQLYYHYGLLMDAK